MQWPWTLIKKKTNKKQNKTKQQQQKTHWTNPNEGWKKELIKQKDFQGIELTWGSYLKETALPHNSSLINHCCLFIHICKKKKQSNK